MESSNDGFGGIRRRPQHEDLPLSVPASPSGHWPSSSRRHRVDPYSYNTQNSTSSTPRRKNWSQSNVHNNPNIAYRANTQQTSRSICSPRNVSHLHPLLHPSSPNTSINSLQSNSSVLPSDGLAPSNEYGLAVSIIRALYAQGQRFADLLTGHPRPRHPPSKYDQSCGRWGIGFMSFLVILYAIYLPSTQKKLYHWTKAPEWQWNKARTLKSRQCSMNLFIEKQANDEFNPDYKSIKDGPLKPPKFAKNTHRTEGQNLVIKRFIGAVADSFRSNKNVFQHLIFANSRDNGQLAKDAMKQWPPRGTTRTQIHILSAPPSEINMDDGLEYGALQGIEDTFQNDPNAINIHIYDHKGERAGTKPKSADDDIEESSSLFNFDDDLTIMDAKELLRVDDDEVLDSSIDLKYPSFRKLLQPLMDEYDEIEHLIPYLHVDGTDATQQMHVLESAKSLLMSKSIVTVGIEHAPNMDVWELIDFFRSVNYKTFLLGKRQTARIDHLCPEILSDILKHPHLNRKKDETFSRSILTFMKIIKKKKQTDNLHLMPEHFQTPPFFVAMPRGRHSKEEMTIQHMYDLFGGLGGGGGQIATANDRKAPGKKKK